VISPEEQWRRYLYEEHSEQTLRRWTRRLSIFRFCRAFGGHAGDGDQLLAAFRYASIPQLLGALRQLGIEPVIHATRPPQPEPGKAYPGDEFARFPSLIDDTRIEQPRHCTIHGVKVFVWCSGGKISISVLSGFQVTEEDVKRAAVLEPLLAALPLERIDPPQDNEHCISPRHYPDWFPEEPGAPRDGN
jgi:hypothetical protein